MKKLWVVLFVFVLVSGLVCAADDWDSFDGDSGEESVLYEEPNSVGVSNDDNFDVVSEGKMGAMRYTDNFYYALVATGIFLFIVLVFLYFFLRGPKEKWKTPKKKVPEPLPN